MNYYNEIEPYAVAWLQNLIEAEHIGAGVVDDRSIRDLALDTAAGFDRSHFFAGIGGWEYALRLAGWPDDRPVWTGSCPCQPFSVAGKRKGIADERHLWPIWYEHIRQCRPPTIFGEQVASKDGREWLIGVRIDLEALGYVFGAADLCAAGVGAPHIRQRLYWVAVTESPRGRSDIGTICDGSTEGLSEAERSQSRRTIECARGSCDSGPARGVADTTESRRTRAEDARTDRNDAGRRTRGLKSERSGADGGLGHSDDTGLSQRGSGGSVQFETLGAHERKAVVCTVDSRWMADADGRISRDGGLQRSGQHRQQPEDAWVSHELIHCSDGKARRIEPGTFPLAHGIPARVGKLRAYGNAIVPQVAAEFIKAFLEAERDR